MRDWTPTLLDAARNRTRSKAFVTNVLVRLQAGGRISGLVGGGSKGAIRT